VARPLFSVGIADLEAAFVARANDLNFLRQLLDELSHRSTLRAVKLRSLVQRALKSDSTDNAAGDRPLIQPRLELVPKEDERFPATSTTPSTLQNKAELHLRLSIPLACLDFSTRARKLFATRSLVYVGDLCQERTTELQILPRIGVRTVGEIVTALERLGTSLGGERSGWTRETARRLERKAVQLAQQLRAGPTSDGLIEALLNDIRSVDPVPRNVSMIAAHLGWDGRGGVTLEEIGSAHGITRERVRQLCARTIKKLKARRAKPLPLVRAIRVARMMAPVTHEALSATLEVEIEPSGFDARGLLTAAEAYGFRLELQSYRFGGLDVLLPRGSDEALLKIARRAVRVVSSRGCTSVEALSADEGLFDTPEGREIVAAIVQQRPSFEWLNEEGGWFWYRQPPGSRRNRLVNTIRKILAATDAISVGEMRAAARRFHKLGGFAPPSRVLGEICRRLPFAEVKGDTVERLPGIPDWSSSLSATDAVFLDVLRRYGPILPRAEFVDRCCAAGLNENTVTVGTTYSPVLWRPAKGYYALVGAQLPPGIVEWHRRNRLAEGARIVGSGWLSDGAPFICWSITASKISSGLFSIPSGLRSVIAGRFELAGGSGEAFGQIQVTDRACWNLSKLLRRVGAEPGDYLALKYDPVSRLSVGIVGGHEIVVAIEEGRPEDIFNAQPAYNSNDDADEQDDLEESDQ
jgi:hypothetical protein